MADAITILEKLAPTIAATFFTPLAGTAVAAVESAFGLTPPPDATIPQRQQTIEDKIVNATPEDLLKLKEADNQHAENMVKLGYDNIKDLRGLQVQTYEIDANDRDSARKREESVKDQIPAILAVLVTFGFFGILIYMMMSDVPKSNKDILNIMLGSLGTAWVSIIAYYFGSSAGSAEKTRLLAQAQPISTGNEGT